MKDEIVRCRGLSCGYSGHTVLQHVDLVVKRGEIVAILGGSGSGKSTILKTLVGLLPPLSGSVSLFGDDLSRVTNRQRRAIYRRVGTLFQRDALFSSMTVLENVTFPLRELAELPSPIVRRLGRARLNQVELLSFESSLPSEISGGQSKRVALARASILDPELLLCDEPTSGLDPVVSSQVDHIIKRFRDVLGMAIIAVSHDIASVRRIADRAVFVADGTVRAQGTVRDLVEHADPAIHDFFHSENESAPGER